MAEPCAFRRPFLHSNQYSSQYKLHATQLDATVVVSLLYIKAATDPGVQNGHCLTATLLSVAPNRKEKMGYRLNALRDRHMNYLQNTYQNTPKHHFNIRIYFKRQRWYRPPAQILPAGDGILTAHTPTTMVPSLKYWIWQCSKFYRAWHTDVQFKLQKLNALMRVAC